MFLTPLQSNWAVAPRRWACSRRLSWRVRGGRRTRDALISERSLSDLVLVVDERDVPAEGTCVHPVDVGDAVRHGFHSGVVRRCDVSPEGRRLVFIEILA